MPMKTTGFPTTKTGQSSPLLNRNLSKSQNRKRPKRNRSNPRRQNLMRQLPQAMSLPKVRRLKRLQ